MLVDSALVAPSRALCIAGRSKPMAIPACMGPIPALLRSAILASKDDDNSAPFLRIWILLISFSIKLCHPSPIIIPKWYARSFSPAPLICRLICALPWSNTSLAIFLASPTASCAMVACFSSSKASLRDNTAFSPCVATVILKDLAAASGANSSGTAAPSASMAGFRATWMAIWPSKSPSKRGLPFFRPMAAFTSVPDPIKISRSET